MENINWKEVIRKIQLELQTFKEQKYKPTLRTIFYRLVSKNILSNTPTTYNSLSKRTVKARLDGRLEIDCFADTGRSIIANFNQEYYTLDAVINAKINGLKNLPRTYKDTMLPRWHNQPEYVEIWTEKAAMSGTFQSMLEGRDVVIVANKGYTSLTFLYENLVRLQEWKQEHDKNIHVLYFGDFDPSGEHMDHSLRKTIEKIRLFKESGITLGFEDIDFQRIAVNKEQIEEYNLPTSLDDKTIKKLEKDRRTEGFKARHDGKLYQVELDALPAIVPDAFRNMVLYYVDQYFDEDIYTENMEEYSYSKEESENLIKEKLRKFLGGGF